MNNNPKHNNPEIKPLPLIPEPNPNAPEITPKPEKNSPYRHSPEISPSTVPEIRPEKEATII